MTSDEVERRIHAYHRHVHEAAATRQVPFRWGTAYLNDDLQRVWDLNFMKVEDASPRIRMKKLIAEADRVMGHLGHRQIWIDDETLARRLAPGFEEAGWRTDRHVAMAQQRSPDHEPDATLVTEVDEATAWRSREEWLRSYERLNDDITIRHLRGQYRLLKDLLDTRDFAVLDSGRAVSFALLHRSGATAEVADVATLEPYRNRGLATAVVWKAVQEARDSGCDVIFLVADDLDWPKNLYVKLGFDAIAYQHYFLLTNPELADRFLT